METLFQDLRHSLRMLRKNPGFTAVAVITLALGIGINSAMFSVVNGVLLQPLPFKDPGRLVVVNTIAREKGQSWSTSPVDFWVLRESNHTFESLAAAHGQSLNLTGREQPEMIKASAVSYEYFATLGATPLLRSTFSADKEQWGHHLELILGEEFWRSYLGADPGVSFSLVAGHAAAVILFGLTASDPVTLALAPGLLVVVGPSHVFCLPTVPLALIRWWF